MMPFSSVLTFLLYQGISIVIHSDPNTVAFVGFEQLEYSGVEGTSVDVCVALFFSSTMEGIPFIGVDVLLDLLTASGECINH